MFRCIEYSLYVRLLCQICLGALIMIVWSCSLFPTETVYLWSPCLFMDHALSCLLPAELPILTTACIHLCFQVAGRWLCIAWSILSAGSYVTSEDRAHFLLYILFLFVALYLCLAMWLSYSFGVVFVFKPCRHALYLFVLCGLSVFVFPLCWFLVQPCGLFYI